MPKYKTNSISWLFSIFNEIKNDFFWKNLDQLKHSQQKIIIVDGGSDDGTIQKLTELGFSYVLLPNSTRGARFNECLRYVDSDITIFVHPRSQIPEGAIDCLSSITPLAHWGAFSHKFDRSHWLLRFTSWWSNYVRGDLKGIFYLDHILWVRTQLIRRIEGFPVEAIFEDTILSQRLLRYHRPLRLIPEVSTSAIRFEHNGILTQLMLNQVAKIRFLTGTSINKINKSYEDGIELNAKKDVK